MPTRSKYYCYFILLLVSLCSCKKDVTSEYVTHMPTQIVVECLFSPQTTWVAYIKRTYQFTEKVPAVPVPPEDIEEVYILENNSKKIPLTYDKEVHAFVNNSYPKQGGHYKIVIKRKNKPDVTAEDTIPSLLEVEKLQSNLSRVEYKGNNDSHPRTCIQNFIKIKGEFSENTFVLIEQEVTNLCADTIEYDNDILDQLKAKGCSDKYIRRWENILGYDRDDKSFYRQKVSYYRVRNDVYSSMFMEIIPQESLEEWTKKKFDFDTASLYELRDIFRVKYKEYKDEYGIIYSNDIIFSKNKCFTGKLLGNLKAYQNNKLEIFTPISYDANFTKSEADAIRYDRYRHRENRVVISHMSKEMNRYLRDLAIQNENSDSKFTPTIRVHSNVNNGLGIFAAKNETKVLLYYSNKEE